MSSFKLLKKITSQIRSKFEVVLFYKIENVDNAIGNEMIENLNYSFSKAIFGKFSETSINSILIFKKVIVCR